MGPSSVFRTISFSCCSGYGSSEGDKGCTFVEPLEPPATAARHSKARYSLDWLESSGLSRSTNPLTIFAPMELAPAGYRGQNQRGYISNAVVRPFENSAILSHHLVSGRYALADITNGQKLTTRYNDQKVTVMKYPNGLVTVDCVPVVEGDILTTTGYIHVIERPLDVSYPYPLNDVLLRDSQLRRFSNLLIQAHMEPSLRIDGPYTILAPSDDAFQQLSHEQSHAILYNPDALRAVVEQHVVLGLHCKAILNNATLKNQHGDVLKTRCAFSTTYIQDAAVLNGDKVASNGVIHIIDKVLLPPRAMLLPQLLQELGLTAFASMIRTSGLEGKLQSTTGAFTLFAPSNKALQGFQGQPYELILDHLVSGKHLLKELRDKQQLTSMSTNRHLHTVRFLRNRNLVDNAVIVRGDLEGLNGVIHVIDRVLPTPAMTVLQGLTSQGNFTYFLSALRKANFWSRLESTQRPITIFAVPDNYWQWSSYYHYYNYNQPNLDKVLGQHVLQDTFFSESIPPGTSTNVATLSSRLLIRRREMDGILTIGTANVFQPDMVYKDGVVHVVDRLILETLYYS